MQLRFAQPDGKRGVKVQFIMCHWASGSDQGNECQMLVRGRWPHRLYGIEANRARREKDIVAWVRDIFS